MRETLPFSFRFAVLILFGFGEKCPAPSAIISDSRNSLLQLVSERRHVLMEMISKLGALARACFFLSSACARLALRLALLLCVRPRSAFPASPFASSASRSAKLEDISTDRRPEHEARERGNFSAPRLWLKCWVLFPVAATEEGDAPRPRRPREATPSATPRPPPDKNFEAPPASMEKNGRARTRTRRACGASRGAYTARLAARTRHVFWRATGAFPGVQNGASSDAQAACSRRAD